MAKRRTKKREGTIQPSRPDTEPPPDIQQHLTEADDSSTKIPLTIESLKELNRQNLRPPLPLLSASVTSRVAHLAKLGGPDLSDLRGYQLPRNLRAMATDLRSYIPPTDVVLAPRPPPLGPLLMKCNINSTLASQKPDIRSLRDTLAVRRPSVSLSTISDDAYEKFLNDMNAAKNGMETGLYLIPILMGSGYPRNLFALDAPFVTMDPFGDNIPAAQPDLYCGEYPPRSLDKSVREALAKHIDPSLSDEMPIIPNFFLEYQDLGIAGRDVKSRTQYDGAIGSRAIHSLQNYGNEELQYDNQPYTFSATYHEDMLVLYAHHVTKPCNEGELPEFHMSLIRSIPILDSRESLIEGITAFRNARDEAKKHRDHFIASANRKRSSQQEQADRQANQFLNALQYHNVSGDTVRQMVQFAQQALQQPAAASAAPSHQITQAFHTMVQPPAVASTAPFHPTTQTPQAILPPPAIASAAPFHPITQAFHTILPPPTVASAAPFHPTTQAFHTMPQPPVAISGDPFHSELEESENEQDLNEGPTPRARVPPSATSTPQRAAPSQKATQHQRPGPSQDASSQPSVKKTRTGRKY